MNKKFWKDKKVLITGHTGFKGTWLSLWLTSLGANVYGYALAPNTSPSLFTILDMESKIDHQIGDVRNLDTFKSRVSSVQPDIIIHMAAQPLVRYSYINPVETYETNVMGVVNLFESARVCCSIKVIINVTTDKCYENKEWAWGYREFEAMGGHDPYSSSKGCSELITSAYRSSYFHPDRIGKHGKAIASARAGNVIGGGDWAEDRLIPDIIKSLTEKQEVIIRNPMAIRPWQHVLEPLSGYMLLAQKLWDTPKEYASAWNFGPLDHDVKTVQSIVEYVTANWIDASWRCKSYDEQPHEAKFLKLDISKAKMYLGWQPHWRLETALDNIIEWHKVYACGKEMVALTLAQIKAYETNFYD